MNIILKKFRRNIISVELIKWWAFISLVTGFMSCSSGKYYADFKIAKKNLDTLAICSPYARIVSVNKGVVLHDSVAANQSSQQMVEQLKILDGKYSTLHYELAYDSFHEEQLLKFFESLDKNSKHLTEIQTPPFIQKFLQDIPHRYCLMLLLWDVHYEHATHPFVYVGSGAPYSALMIPIGGQGQTDLRLFVFDKKMQSIAYYNKNQGNVSSILRPLYYKFLCRQVFHLTDKRAQYSQFQKIL